MPRLSYRIGEPSPRYRHRASALPARLRTRPPLDRMRQIFHAIKSGAFPNRHDLASDIEVTTKTIQRDIDFMRDRLSVPIAYNTLQQGYEFTGPVDDLPLVELSEAELVSVFVAQRALAQYKGTPFEHPLRSAFDKLVTGLEGRVSLSWDDLATAISFRGFELAPADLRIFQTVCDAVRGNLVLEFDYCKLNAAGWEKRRIEPLHLACVQNQWYCFGHDLQRDALRTFVLARMKHARTPGRVFDRRHKFDIREHLRGSFGVFAATGSRKKPHHVRLRFDRFAAQLVRERVWHPSQEIQELTNGELELRLTLDNLAEIEPWVLGWGDHARALGPRDLTRRLATVARHFARHYPSA